MEKEMRKRRSGVWLGILAVAASVLWAGAALAVQGECSNCHTMHNSQDGTDVNTGGPFGALLNDGCIGCHTGTNDRTGGKPFVLTSAEPTYAPGTAGNQVLAGGNFYWVAAAGGNINASGHNVVGIASADTLTSPPGFGSGEAAPDGTIPGNGSWTSQQISCAGTYGCHGTHGSADDFDAIKGAHHGDKKGAVVLTAPASATVGESYRFLQGVQGYEDSDWELTVGATDHNQYKGVDGVSDDTTISALCARCHGVFHGTGGETSNSAGAWIRHPTDFDLANAGGEYAFYNGGNGTTATYSIQAPVASADINAILSTVTTGGAGNDTSIVTCISCHRAHASPYADILRWQYSDMSAGTTVAGAAGTGCFVCHTTKDGI